MASGEKLLERLRRTKAGWSSGQFNRLLKFFGFERRPMRHGTLYRSPELAKHADPDVRRKAQVGIPKGRDLRRYVGEDVEAAIDALLDMRGKSHE